MVRQLNSGVPALGNILVKFCCDVTYALAENKLGAVPPECEDEVIVSPLAAPSVRAGKKLFEKQLSVVSSCQ